MHFRGSHFKTFLGEHSPCLVRNITVRERNSWHDITRVKTYFVQRKHPHQKMIHRNQCLQVNHEQEIIVWEACTETGLYHQGGIISKASTLKKIFQQGFQTSAVNAFSRLYRIWRLGLTKLKWFGFLHVHLAKLPFLDQCTSWTENDKHLENLPNSLMDWNLSGQRKFIADCKSHSFVVSPEWMFAQSIIKLR